MAADCMVTEYRHIEIKKLLYNFLSILFTISLFERLTRSPQSIGSMALNLTSKPS